MLAYHTKDLENQQLFKLLLGGVAPRPIALASTIDASGRPNLSPFSFYNVFGVNPTTLIFSPSRRGRDNTTKDTLENLKAVPEVVIHAVTYGMVQQVNLASHEYGAGVNEFEKGGFTSLPSEKVKPFRVKESPFQLECRVREIIETSGESGSANLVICEVLVVHVDEAVLDTQGGVDARKIDLVGRLGGDDYVRAAGEAVFKVKKPGKNTGMGIDQLPFFIKNSNLLTGNDLGKLGSMEKLPHRDQIISATIPDRLRQADKTLIHLYAHELLEQDRVEEAFCVLMAFGA
jgi:flavin reductase (DIM6/NTAB) family NADH-FMN oxidoreductase RutF